MATYQWKENPSVVHRVYMDYIRVVWDTVMVGKIGTRGTGGKTTKTWKNKEEIYQSIQCDILVPYIVSNMYLSDWEQL
jgi:hypothetical protein